MSNSIKHIKSVFFSYAALFMIVACEPREEMLRTENDFLYISTDTLRFDTIFSQQLSITRRAKVINPHAEAVLISAIDLAFTDSSPFDLIVNGRPSAEFRNQTLLGGDSLLLLVNLTTPSTADTLPFRIQNVINIATQQYNSTIALEATGENVDYVAQWHISNDTVISQTKPIVIEKGIQVDSAATLVLEKGSRIYFKSGADFKVYGSLRVEGDAKEKVVLRSFRRDGIHATSLGQWQGLAFMPGSGGHSLSGLTILNAVNGIVWEIAEDEAKQRLLLENANIQHASKTGVMLKNIHLNANNVLLNDCVNHLLQMEGEATATLVHCTLANYAFNFFRSAPAVMLADNINANIRNTVIWGNLRDEMSVNMDALTQSNNFFKSSLDVLAENNSYVNVNPEFTAPPRYNFLPDSISPLLSKAIPGLSEKDMRGNNRKDLPDIGAIERLIN